MRANIYKIHAFCEDADGNRIASTETGFNIVGADEVKVLKNASAYLKEKYPAAVQVHFEGGASLVAANVIVSPEGEGPRGEGEDEEGSESGALGATGTGLPSADDLDKAAAEQKNKDATATA